MKECKTPEGRKIGDKFQYGDIWYIATAYEQIKGEWFVFYESRGFTYSVKIKGGGMHDWQFPKNQ